MTIPEAIERLKELQASGDHEAAHSHADKVLLALIDNPEVTAAFDSIEKWYA